MKNSACGLADLVDLLQAGRSDLLPVMAELIGYEYTQAKSPLVLDSQGGATVSVSIDTTPGKPDPEKLPLAAVPFWRVTGYQSLQVSETEDISSTVKNAAVDYQPKASWPSEAPQTLPLASWPDLLPRIRAEISEQKPGRTIDPKAIVQRLSRGQLLNSMPRKPRRCWGRQAHIIVDKSRRLTPYWQDQQQLSEQLLAVFPKGALSFAHYWDGMSAPMPSRSTVGSSYSFPLAGTLVLAMTDLGCLSVNQASQAFWIRFGQQLLDHGCRPVAILPCASVCNDAHLRRIWTLCGWEPKSLGQASSVEDQQAQTEALLTLLSPAIRIEPGLLRAMRRRVLRVSAGVEALAWQHPAMTSACSEAGTLDPDAALELRKKFANVSTDQAREQRRQALALIRSWRTRLPREIWFEEICNLTAELRVLLPDQQDVADMEHFFHDLRGKTKQNQGLQGVDHWFRRLERRISEAAWQDAVIKKDLHQLWWWSERDNPNAQLPPGFDPRSIPEETKQKTRMVTVSQVNEQLMMSAGAKQLDGLLSSLVGQISTGNGQIKIGPDDVRNHFWKSRQPPEWATDWGVDQYGQWVEFAVKHPKTQSAVTQRMRWIESGTFVMGSPEDEPGRYSGESPQHQVTLTQGYWLFDTPVTQALYQAVTDSTSSRFKSAQRPVEQVSWKDTRQFIQRLNQKCPGLNLSLPTEAQWEHACRAGTTEATYAGAMEILGERNAPILDDIAWYGGNSGVDFDLEDGYDSSDWEEKQYDHNKTGTRIVAQKQANVWGIYDLLGNVWEWCEDGQREYTKEPEIDPLGSQEDGASRVLRGGSWYYDARNVRCAYRFAYPPEYADYGTGFRCARVHEPGTGPEAEPAEPQQGRVAEQRTAAARTSAARLVDCRNLSVSQSIDWPQLERFVIHSDREKLYVEQFAKPLWAYAIGRDTYGLWVSFQVESESGALVSQKMRWIPPGRFLMGSPENEPGRITQQELEKEHKGYDLKSEGPRHRVEITQGYWLFDTLVTQGLYEAVMSENPSKFKSVHRPVEQVSWNDAQRFIETMNEKIPGLDLSLPSEAQWEYACRAGTTEATYAGAIEILGRRNAPGLDAIAWYGGNSGHKFDLEEGYDSSDWLEKQYEHTQAGTRMVTQKKANDWGVYDLLGNVWEWCEDGLRDYTEEAVVNPHGSSEDGASRVLRGGSWSNDARDVRCAVRVANPPEDAFISAGFRCARVHEPGAERRGHPTTRVAEQRVVDDTDRGD